MSTTENIPSTHEQARVGLRERVRTMMTQARTVLRAAIQGAGVELQDYLGKGTTGQAKAAQPGSRRGHYFDQFMFDPADVLRAAEERQPDRTSGQGDGPTISREGVLGYHTPAPAAERNHVLTVSRDGVLGVTAVSGASEGRHSQTQMADFVASASGEVQSTNPWQEPERDGLQHHIGDVPTVPPVLTPDNLQNLEPRH